MELLFFFLFKRFGCYLIIILGENLVIFLQILFLRMLKIIGTQKESSYRRWPLTRRKKYNYGKAYLVGFKIGVFINLFKSCFNEKKIFFKKFYLLNLFCRFKCAFLFFATFSPIFVGTCIMTSISVIRFYVIYKGSTKNQSFSR